MNRVKKAASTPAHSGTYARRLSRAYCRICAPGPQQFGVYSWLMEGERVRVVDDGSGDEPEQWNPARRWWIAAATAFGFAFAVALLVVNMPSTNEAVTDPLEALPAATTTTMPPTTTTLALGRVIRDLANIIGPDVRVFCERASPAGAVELDDVVAWRDSVNQADFETVGFDSRGTSYPSRLTITLALVYFEILDAQTGVRRHHQVLLYSVTSDLQEVGSAVARASQALDDGDSDEWTYQVARIERHCPSAITVVETMKAMSATVDGP
jgi:hypothetical protein